MTEPHTPDRRPDVELAGPSLPRLPAGAGGILPTIVIAFGVTVTLALTFSFANVWDLGRTLKVERHVAPLIGPTVDITAFGLMVVVPWLVLAGASVRELRPAITLMRIAGFLTLALNSAPAAIQGAVHRDPAAWGRAGVEAIVPILLIAWSHVGPKLIALFVEVRTRHRDAVEEARRLAEESSVEAAQRRAAEVAEAVEEALRGASVEWQQRLVETRDAASTEFAEALAEARAAEEQISRELAAARAAEQQLLASVEDSTEEVRRLRDRVTRLSGKAPRRSSTKPRGGSTTGSVEGSAEAGGRAPRKSKEELLQERVEAAKDALPTWQLETPSGPEVASALGLKSEGTISDIRKRLEADRLALAPKEES